jgi:hypothetical protein
MSTLDSNVPDVVRLVVTYGRYGAVTFSKLTNWTKISARPARDIS